MKTKKTAPEKKEETISERLDRLEKKVKEMSEFQLVIAKTLARIVIKDMMK